MSLGRCQIIKGIGANERSRGQRRTTEDEKGKQKANQTENGNKAKQIKGSKVRKLVNFQLILMNRC